MGETKQSKTVARDGKGGERASKERSGLKWRATKKVVDKIDLALGAERAREGQIVNIADAAAEFLLI